MKYRIKRFPYKGKLLYMPQRRGWYFWHDMIINDIQVEYTETQLNFMSCKSSCTYYIKSYDDNQLRHAMNSKEIKEPKKNNPTEYIYLGDIK